jgi:hypothetical protein
LAATVGIDVADDADDDDDDNTDKSDDCDEEVYAIISSFDR